MDADAINKWVDNIEDASEEVVEDYLLDVALVAALGTTTGFFALLLTPLIKKVVSATAFQLMRWVKRKGQKRIDIIEGQMIIKGVDQAVEDDDEDAYITAIGRY